MTITIRVRTNGPYFIPPEDAPHVRLEDAEGNLFYPPPGKGIALCRCGGSSRKPFCDASHKTNGFDGTCARQEPPQMTGEFRSS